MKLLAIDTAANFSSACVWDTDKGEVIADDCRDIGRGHAEILMQQIEDCLAKSGIEYSDIGRVGVACGPGSFTGIRVGLSVARGLALALDIPAIGISCLEACAEAADISAPLFCALNGNRGQVYCLASGWDTPRLLSVEDAAQQVAAINLPVCGSGAPLIADHVDKPLEVLHEMSAMPVATYAKLAASKAESQSSPEPIYLRSADAKPQTGFALQRESG